MNIAFSGSNLIINSLAFTDLQLLGIRKKFLQLNALLGETAKDYAFSFTLSGVMRARLTTPIMAGTETTDIDVTNMSFDATILGPSDWILGS